MKKILLLLTFISLACVGVGQTTIAQQDFDNSTPAWNYSNDIIFFDNGWGDDGFYGIISFGNSSPLSYDNFSGNILGENDLDDEGDFGTTGFATVDFSSVNIGAYEDVILSFDYEILGYNASGDDAKFTLFYNGISCGDSLLLDGGVDAIDAQGHYSLAIPDTVHTLGLKVSICNNGQDGFSGFDNFKLEGNPGSTTVQFISSSATLNEGAGTYSLTLEILNPDATNATTCNVALSSGSAADIGNYVTQAITFPSGSASDQTISVTITDDSTPEEEETFTFEIQNVSGGDNAAAGNDATFDMILEDNDLPSAWINEIHYDNVSTDDNEMIEVAIENPASLSKLTVSLYNGSNGTVYDSETLDKFSVGETQGSFTFYTWFPSSIQNDLDGLALDYDGTLIQFLSYEGTFDATDGPAMGATSEDIGEEETGSTHSNASLQLGGAGSAYEDFSWNPPATATSGNINGTQILGTGTNWRGTVSNAWSEASNWSNGVPGDAMHVVIDGDAAYMPTISSPASCNTIILEEGATLVGQENLTVNGTASCKRDFIAYSSSLSADGWYAISWPASEAQISGSDIEPGSNDDLFEYDESNNMWLNYDNGSFDDTHFAPGKGYLVSYEASAIKSFSGNDFNKTDNIVVPVTENNSRWNLIGNPYPSLVNWSSVNSVNLSSAKTLNNVTGAWEDMDTEMGVSEGIFVYAEDIEETPSLEFNLDDQAHSSSEKGPEEFTFLLAHFDSLTVHIRFKADAKASEKYEYQYDARYLYPATGIPYLSAITEDNVMASTYVFNEAAESIVVPLYFSVSEEQEIFYNKKRDIGYEMAIEDLLTQTITDIDTNKYYQFMAHPADDEHRFNLHLTKSSTIGLDENEELTGVHVYANKRNIYFNADENLTNATLTVYNTIGQVVLTTNVESGSKTIRMENRGAYLVKVQSNQGSISKKVIIQ